MALKSGLSQIWRPSSSTPELSAEPSDLGKMSITTSARLTPSSHPSDDEWEKVSTASHNADVQPPSAASDGAANVESGKNGHPKEAHPALKAFYSDLATHIDYTRGWKRHYTHKVLLEKIHSALGEHGLSSQEIIEFVRGSPHSVFLWDPDQRRSLNMLPTMRRYGEEYTPKGPEGEMLIAESLALCLDDYLKPQSTQNKDESASEAGKMVKNVAKPSEESVKHATPPLAASSPRIADDEPKDVTSSVETVGAPDTHLKLPSSDQAASEMPTTSDNKHRILQEIHAALATHVWHPSQDTQVALRQNIHLALRAHKLSPAEINDFIRISPRVPHSSVVSCDNKQYLNMLAKIVPWPSALYLEGPEGKTLVQDVLLLCLDEYLSLKSTDRKTETTPIAEKTRKQADRPTEESMEHAMPRTSPISALPAIETASTLLSPTAEATASHSAHHFYPIQSDGVSATTAASLIQNVAKPSENFVKHATPTIAPPSARTFDDEPKHVTRSFNSAAAQDSPSTSRCAGKPASEAPRTSANTQRALEEIYSAMLDCVKWPSNPLALIFWQKIYIALVKPKLSPAEIIAFIRASPRPPQSSREKRGEVMETVKMLRNTLSTRNNPGLQCRSLLAADVLERCLNEYLQMTTEELKREFVRLVKDNPDAWRVLNARYGGGAKPGLGIWDHPAKLDTCVHPLIKRKVTKEVKHSSFPHCSLAAFSRPKKDSRKATREVQGTQRPPTDRFEEMLTEHVHAPVVTNEAASPTTAPSLSKPYIIQQVREDAASFSSSKSTRARPRLAKNTHKPPQASIAPAPLQSIRATFLHFGRDASDFIDKLPLLLEITFWTFVVLASIAFLVCTVALCEQNFEHIHKVLTVVGSYVYAVVRLSWRTMWVCVRAPLILLGCLCSPFVALQSTAAPVPSTEAWAANTTTMQDISTLIPKWAVIRGAQRTNSGHSSGPNATSPSGMVYKSWHGYDNGFRLEMEESYYPFTRHNNSLPYADRCEDFVHMFGRYWGEEMDEKRAEEGRFDLELGEAMAEVLVRHCK